MIYMTHSHITILGLMSSCDAKSHSFEVLDGSVIKFHFVQGTVREELKNWQKRMKEASGTKCIATSDIQLFPSLGG